MFHARFFNATKATLISYFFVVSILQRTKANVFQFLCADYLLPVAINKVFSVPVALLHSISKHRHHFTGYFVPVPAAAAGVNALNVFGLPYTAFMPL